MFHFITKFCTWEIWVTLFYVNWAAVLRERRTEHEKMTHRTVPSPTMASSLLCAYVESFFPLFCVVETVSQTALFRSITPLISPALTARRRASIIPIYYTKASGSVTVSSRSHSYTIPRFLISPYYTLFVEKPRCTSSLGTRRRTSDLCSMASRVSIF